MTVWTRSENGWLYETFEPDENAPELGEFLPLVELWRSKRARSSHPAWRDFDLMDFKGWWGWLAVADVVPDETDAYRFRLWGTKIVNLYGIEMTGRTLSKANEPSDVKTAIASTATDFAFYSHIVNSGEIGLMSGRQYWRNRDYLNHRELHLPLANEGEEVDGYLVAMSVSE